MRFGVSEGQPAVLGRAAAGLRADREQLERGQAARIADRAVRMAIAGRCARPVTGRALPRYPDRWPVVTTRNAVAVVCGRAGGETCRP